MDRNRNISELLPDEPIPPTFAAEIIFNNNVRNVIVVAFFILFLIITSQIILCYYKRRDVTQESSLKRLGSPALTSSDDEAASDRIAMILCNMSLSVSQGAVVLLLLSTLLYNFKDNQFHQWFSKSFMQILWNMVFLLSNFSLFVALPFAYFFTEAAGFPGTKKGMWGKIKETLVVLILFVLLVLGVIFVIACLFGYIQLNSITETLKICYSFYLPFMYSILSCLGVLFLLLCTPVGLVRLFSTLKNMIRGSPNPRQLHPSLYDALYSVSTNINQNIKLEDLHSVAMEEQALARQLRGFGVNVSDACNHYAKSRRADLSLPLQSSYASPHSISERPQSLPVTRDYSPIQQENDTYFNYNSNALKAILTSGRNYSKSVARAALKWYGFLTRFRRSTLLLNPQRYAKSEPHVFEFSACSIHHQVKKSASNDSIVDAAASTNLAARDKAISLVSTPTTVNGMNTNASVYNGKWRLSPPYDWKSDEQFDQNQSFRLRSHSEVVRPLYKSLTGFGSVQEAEAQKVANLRKRWKAASEARVYLEKLSQQGLLRRNVLYPAVVLLLTFITCVVVVLVVFNTLQLVSGFKALPLLRNSSSDIAVNSPLVKFTLLVWLLGPAGAGVEALLICYLAAASLVGCYSLPYLKRVKPVRGNTAIVHLIFNCVMLLLLASALPLLATTLGVTSFDLLGDYGRVSWLGNFWIVLVYNIGFVSAEVWCLRYPCAAALCYTIHRVYVFWRILRRKATFPSEPGDPQHLLLQGTFEENFYSLDTTCDFLLHTVENSTSSSKRE